jgi:hypothetical protein
MSRATELAKAEAAEAEAEQPDEETTETEGEDAPPEPPQPPAPPGTDDDGEEEEEAEQPEQAPEAQALTEAEVKDAMRKLEKEDQRHAKRYAEVLGDQFQLMQPCPRCLESGHVYPWEVAPLDPEQVAAVDASLGRANAPELKAAKDAVRCEECAGWGQVTTGAQNPQGAVKPCTPCGGLGWVPPAAQAALSIANGGGSASPSGEDVVVDLQDGWGRPAGHPHWGQDPATIGV